MSYRRDSYNGYGNGLAKAFELTMTPALFGGIGYLIDGKAGTRPWFTIGLTLFAIVGMFVKMWFGYDDEMKRHEKNFAGSVHSGSNADAGAVPEGVIPAATTVLRATLPTGVTLDDGPSASGQSEQVLP